MPVRRTRRYAAVLAAVGLLAGCSGQGSAQTGAAESAARQFLTQRASDPGRACMLLAPRTLEEVEGDGPCPQGVAARGGAPSDSPRVDVYGTDAIVRFADDTVFLALFDRGWLVTAADCTPRGTGRPFDCSISGG